MTQGAVWFVWMQRRRGWSAYADHDIPVGEHGISSRSTSFLRAPRQFLRAWNAFNGAPLMMVWCWTGQALPLCKPRLT